MDECSATKFNICIKTCTLCLGEGYECFIVGDLCNNTCKCQRDDNVSPRVGVNDEASP